MPNIAVLQHIECETLGMMENIFRKNDIDFSYTKTFNGDKIPHSLADFNALIIMGGPMAVYESDKFPFILDEITLIKNCLRANKPILGICLGSQLLASTLGSNIVPGPVKEIGWYKIHLDPQSTNDPLFHDLDDSFSAFLWHGDIFKLPSGATKLASSDLTDCQAFKFGTNAYGLLFHLETTQKIALEMVDIFKNEIKEQNIPDDFLLNNLDDRIANLSNIGKIVFTRWIESFVK